MKQANFLLPPVYKKIGWCMLFPFVLMILWIDDNLLPMNLFAITYFNPGNLPDKIGWFDIINNTVWDEIIVIGITVSLLFICFSREKDEDECIGKIRLESLVWSLVISYTVLILATILIFDQMYICFSFANSFTVLIVFIIVFNWKMHKFRKSSKWEGDK